MIALGSGKIINIKPGRVGGFTASKAIHDLCADCGNSCLVRRNAREWDRPGAQRGAGVAAKFLTAGRL